MTPEEAVALASISECYLYKLKRNAQRGRIARIIRRDGTRCWLCDLELSFTNGTHPAPDSVSIDHVIPVVRKGTLGVNLENAKLAHRACNSSRHAHKRGVEARLVVAKKKVLRYWRSAPHSIRQPVAA